MSQSILWCTGHYTKTFCQQKAKEIRSAIKQGDERYAMYSRVSIVDKVVEFMEKDGKYQDVQFNRLRLHYK